MFDVSIFIFDLIKVLELFGYNKFFTFIVLFFQIFYI